MLKRIAAGFGFVVTLLMASWLGGRNAGKTAAKAKELQGYVDTRKRMDEVDTGDDPAVLRDWLRERGKSKRDL
jgi:hypothetical protein